MDQQANQITDPREMRKIISKVALRGERVDGKEFLQPSMAASLARHILMTGEIAGLSGEDTMTMLAYHALLRYENAMDRLLEQAMLDPSPRLFDNNSFAHSGTASQVGKQSG